MIDVSLKEYLESRIDAVYGKFAIEMRSIKEATEKFERLLQTRLEGLNEWRDQNKDIISKFVTKNEVNLQIMRLNDRIENMSEKISNLEIFRAELKAKADQKSVNIAYLFSAISAVIAIISLLINILGR